MQRNCQCPLESLQRISVLLSQNSLPFDHILRVGAELTGHIKTVLDCQRCGTTRRMANVLSQTTSRLVCFYEAAYLNATATPTTTTTSMMTTSSTTMAGTTNQTSTTTMVSTSPPSHHHDQMDAPPASAACQSVFCEMKLGKLCISGTEARMLVEVVLVDSCLDLNERMQEWKNVMDGSLEGAEEQYDVVITRCLDRLAKLIGLLQFDGLLS